jgi:hypothetical protein
MDLDMLGEEMAARKRELAAQGPRERPAKHKAANAILSRIASVATR